MRKYEVAVIIDPDVDDRHVQPLVDKYAAVVTKANGIVDETNVWGRRKLSYDINKKSEGTYVFYEITAEPAVVQELDRLLTIDEQIMRTKVMRKDAK